MIFLMDSIYKLYFFLYIFLVINILLLPESLFLLMISIMAFIKPSYIFSL